MGVDERARHGMYEAIKQVIGMDHATTLMDHLPPGGWNAVATKEDFRHLETEFRGLEGKFRGLEGKFREHEQRIDARFEEHRRATKRDLDALEERIDLRVEAKLHEELRENMRSLFYGFFAMQAAFTSIIGVLVVTGG